MDRDGTQSKALAGRSPLEEGDRTQSKRRGLVIAPLLASSILGLGLYLWLGSPNAASETSAAAPVQQAADALADHALLTQTEAYLESHPEDGRGWEVLAPVYMQLGRYPASVLAWRRALQYSGENAQREAGLGEALTAEADGTVTADAKAAFARALEMDGKTVVARYYLGLAAEQKGDRDQAGKIWRELLAEAPADAFWLNDLRNGLARLEGAPATQPPALPPFAAAQSSPHGSDSPEIRGMVDRLAARLEQDGSDADGWVRLVRSYKVLGETEKANAAAAKARQSVAGDQAKLQKLNSALNDLEGESTEEAPPMAAAATLDGHGNDASMQTLVERLAGRLKVSGSDPEGWLMLVRSYVTLEEKDKVPATIADARRALASSPEKLERFNKALATFNIGN